MDRLEILKGFLHEVEENGSLSILMSEDFFGSLKQDLIELINLMDDLRNDDDTSRFDNFLNYLDYCREDMILLESEVCKVENTLSEIHGIILEKFIPEDYYDNLELENEEGKE